MTKISAIWRWLCPFAVVLGLANPGTAQPKSILGLDPHPPRPYVRFPINPDYEKILRERLEMEQELGPFKDLVRQVLADPKMLEFIPANAKQMKLEDPKFKKAIQTWLESDPKLQKSLLEWVKQNQQPKQPAEVKRLQEDLKLLLDTTPGNEGNGAPLPQPKPIEPIKPADDSLAKMTEQAMKQAERTRLGEYLRESPAWQRAFEDLRESLNRPDEPAGMVSDWTTKLFKPNSGTWKLADSALERLRDAPRPKLDGFNWSRAIPGIGKIPLPDLGAPGASDLSGPSFSSIGAAASWILALLIALLIAARLGLWRKRAATKTQERPVLGPWPVRPEAVTTRAELIQAFDYLALWTLGLGVKSWNHHAVAGRWRERAPSCGELTQALERLYEQARYTDGVELLTEPERDSARRSLVQIAEVL